MDETTDLKRACSELNVVPHKKQKTYDSDNEEGDTKMEVIEDNTVIECYTYPFIIEEDDQIVKVYVRNRPKEGLRDGDICVKKNGDMYMKNSGKWALCKPMTPEAITAREKEREREEKM